MKFILDRSLQLPIEIASSNQSYLMNSIHSHKKKKNSNTNNNEKIYAHKMPTPQNRILLDTPCKVCGDNSSGKHYGIHTCDGCSGFFKRSIRKQKAYPCKSGDNSCPITRSCRNQCRSCRLRRCREMGMLEESVQQERGPRNSTSGSSARGSTPATTMRMHARESTGGGGGIGPLRGGSSGTGRGLLGNCAISHSDPYPITAGRLMMPNISLAPSSTTTAAAAAASSATLSQVLGPELQPHLAAAAYHNHLLSQFPQLQDPTSQYNEMLRYITFAQLAAAGHMSNNPSLLWPTR